MRRALHDHETIAPTELQFPGLATSAGVVFGKCLALGFPFNTLNKVGVLGVQSPNPIGPANCPAALIISLSDLAEELLERPGAKHEMAIYRLAFEAPASRGLFFTLATQIDKIQGRLQ